MAGVKMAIARIERRLEPKRARRFQLAQVVRVATCALLRLWIAAGKERDIGGTRLWLRR